MWRIGWRRSLLSGFLYIKCLISLIQAQRSGMEAVVSSLSGIMIRPGVCSSRRKAGEKPVANQSQVGRMPGFLGGGSSPRRRVPGEVTVKPQRICVLEEKVPSPANPPLPAGFLRSKMGARPSRRRLPADSPMALDALPPELLVQVLSHVPPRALITRCRPVCRAWRDVVDGPTVWLLQLARDRSAEGRALYAVAQRCPPNSEDEEEFPLCALARYCLRAPLGRNLIFNSCGERGCRARGQGGLWSLGAQVRWCEWAGPG